MTVILISVLLAVTASTLSSHVSIEMVRIPGGEFWMGSNDSRFADAKPVHRVRLSSFWIDQTLITNDEFARFVKATGYVTVAEKKPLAKDFPGATAEDLVPGSAVFTPPNGPVSLDDQLRWWSYVPGADWRHPKGPGSSIAGRATHPVVQVAYDDAAAYCAWAGKRLPTEAEFEYAQRGGLDRKAFAWGDKLMPSGRPMANTFQGNFPNHNTTEDGYAETSPVGTFPANGYGLFDMSGNVWEWTSDWYRPDYYQTVSQNGAVVAENPKGPADSFDPDDPGVPNRVHRGGSFLCSDQYCSRYMAGARGKGEPSTGTNHLGFRCVKDAQTGVSHRTPGKTETTK